MLNQRRTSSRAYAFGIRVNDTLFMAGFTPSDLLIGIRWDRGHLVAHFGLFMLGVLWGVEDE